MIRHPEKCIGGSQKTDKKLSNNQKTDKMEKLKKIVIDELRKEANKNFLWRMWDFAKYHKEVVEEKTNPSETAYMVLNCAISDAFRIGLLAYGLDEPSGLPLNDEDNCGNVFTHLLATGEVDLNRAEKDMLTSFDVVKWYNLGVEELKNKYVLK